MTSNSAAERRAGARSAYLISMGACLTHRVLDRMGDRWVSLILKELAAGPRRHGELALSGARRRKCLPRRCEVWSVTAWWCGR
jgi:DNA-binding HxlR family transcriptional regulator